MVWLEVTVSTVENCVFMYVEDGWILWSSNLTFQKESCAGLKKYSLVLMYMVILVCCMDLLYTYVHTANGTYNVHYMQYVNM
mgnify:CR=1 FL=1